jgi:hypothetical protein
VERHPDSVLLKTNYLEFLRNNGLRDEVVAFGLSALEQHPDELVPLWELARAKHFDHPAFGNLADYLERDGLKTTGVAEDLDSLKALIYFMYHDSRGEHDLAFAHLVGAKAKRHLAGADALKSLREQTAAIMALFTELPALPDSGLDDETPVFIVGMPRSGSSLVEQILTSHSQVAGLGELPILPNILYRDAGRSGYLQAMQKYGPDDYREMAETYLASVRAQAEALPRVTDKALTNFLHIGFIFALFPRARVIHCKRDPVDNCFSIFKSFFPTSSYPYLNDLATLGEFYKRQRRMMNLWHERYPGEIHDVQYEALVGNFDREARALIDYLGLQWEDSCSRFHENRRRVRTASEYQIRSELYSDAVSSAEPYRKHLAPLLHALEA